MANKILTEMEPQDDLFHKEIIETFFGKTQAQPPRTEQAQKPPVIKKPEVKPQKKRFHSSALIYISVLAAGLIALFGVFRSVGNIGRPADAKGLDSGSKAYVEIFSDGMFDKNLVNSFSFEGDSKEGSLFLNNSLLLTNTGHLGWARASFSFKEPQDFTGGYVLLFAKSSPGVRHTMFVMTDEKSRKTFAPLTLSPNWEWKRVDLKEQPISGDFDFTKIKAFDIELGYDATGNSRNTKIYIKNIGIRNI